MYQKCVEKIVVEPNRWVNKGGNDLQLSIYFSPRVFRYCPKFSEIQVMIDGLVKIYGFEYVNQETGGILKE